MSDLRGLRVKQEDVGSDAVALDNIEEGITYLFVNPDQSWDFAVKSVMKACPDLTLQQVQELLREHCPDIREMNERLGIDTPLPRVEAAPAPVAELPVPDKGAHRRPRPPRWARVAAIAAPALVGGTLLAHFFSPAGNGQEQRTGQGVAISKSDTPSVFDNPTFKQYIKGSKLRCESVGQYAAKCVDEDGQVMFGDASVGDSVVFTFSYEGEKLGFRVFDSASDASMWVSEEGNKRLYHGLTISGRVVLWGTDTTRLREWQQALNEQAAAQPHAMGGARPAPPELSALPKRLAVLALGTLGVTPDPRPGDMRVTEVHQAQTLRAVELVMGVGAPDDGPDHWVPSGVGDAVAVAADALVPVVVTGPTADSAAPPSPIVTAPVSSPQQPAVPVTSEPVVTAPASAQTPAPSTEPTQRPASGGSAGTTPAPAESQPQPTTPAPVAPTPAPADPAPERPADTSTAPTKDPATAEPDTGTPASDPAPTEPAPAEETPQDGTEAPDTTPAPPAEEEPEDGLSIQALPVAWTA